MGTFGDGGQPTASASAPSLGGVTICEHYDDSPMPPGYTSDGCWTADDYFQAPPEVNPDVTDSDPILRIEASGSAPFGIEGTLFFVRVVSPSGKVVMEREWQWPSMNHRIPPGAYQVTAYARTCDGNCGLLDPPGDSCTVDLLAEPSMTLTMSYSVAHGGTVDCDVSVEPSN